MAINTKIEWTDTTWNPLRGCTVCSPGCVHCYAKTFAERWRGIAGHPFEFGFDFRLVPEKLEDPLRWKEPKKIFVNSMSDLFHEQAPDDYIEKVCRVMLQADWHTFQVLTKRADRMATLLEGRLRAADISKNKLRGNHSELDPAKSVFRQAARAPHIWWGVSVENRKHGLPRIDELRRAGAARSFLSVEPLLEDLGRINLRGVEWVIFGGESGPGARPCHAEWIRSGVEQCRAGGVPAFVKQLGRVPIVARFSAGCKCDFTGNVIIEHAKGGDMSEWPQDLRVREFPA